MRAALFALFAPLALASPMPLLHARQNETTKSCTAQSPSTTEWQVEDFDFHASYVFSQPAHQNSWGYVSFTLVNAVHDASVNCSAATDRVNDFFYGDVEYECDTAGAGADIGETKFAFDRASGKLALEQSWYCRDDPQFPAKFTAKGDAIAQLTCDEDLYENKNWTVGEIYSRRDVTCDLTDFVVPIKEMTGIA